MERAITDIMTVMGVPPEMHPETESGIAALSRNERIALIVIFLIALGYAGWKYFSGRQTAVELGEDIPYEGGGIVVQVEGAVENPGMVFLPHGSRLGDAVEAAGGFTSQADTSEVNLAHPLEDGERIDIPYAGDSPGSQSRSGDVYSLEFREYLIPGDENLIRDDSHSYGGSSLVNINTADEAELQTLPGIGEELAQRIVRYRAFYGQFERIEDIMEVEGIGEGRFDAIRDLITVD